MRRFGTLVLDFVECFDPSLESDDIWANSLSFLTVRSLTEFTSLVLLSNILSIFCCNDRIMSLITRTVSGREQYDGHNHHGVSCRIEPSVTHCSWCQRKHMQHGIMSPSPDLSWRQFSWQYISTEWTSDVSLWATVTSADSCRCVEARRRASVFIGLVGVSPAVRIADGNLRCCCSLSRQGSDPLGLTSIAQGIITLSHFCARAQTFALITNAPLVPGPQCQAGE